MLVSGFPSCYTIPIDWFFDKSVYNNNACDCETCDEDRAINVDCDTFYLNVNNNSSLSRKRRGRQTTFHRVCAHPCLRLNLSAVEREESFATVLSPAGVWRFRGGATTSSSYSGQSDSGNGRMGTGASSSKSPSVVRSSARENDEAPPRPQMPVRGEQMVTSPLVGGAKQTVNNKASSTAWKKKGHSGKDTVIASHSSKDKPDVSTSTCTCTPPSHRRKPTSPPSYEAYGSLTAIFKEEGRQLDYVQGDGNCFFRALSKEIYGSEDCHYELRQTIVDLMAGHRAEFEQFTDTCTQSFADHVEEMRQFAVWATTAEIYAASTLLQRDIYVFSPDHTGNQYSWLHFSPCFPHSNNITTSCPQCYITVCHTNGNHYDTVTPLNGSCNCSLPPPELSGDTQTVGVTKESSSASLYALSESDDRLDRTKRPGE
ncbi:uncharacterized protein LOC135481922 [Liolophura sinensis]|uniref:uncharacterized protein LOC135481922 n=1 Tax=Liolophura sinensis TaxID=3198878 RepID=UPI0031580B0F